MCTVPAFRALRAAYPKAEITLIGLPWAVSFVKRFHRYIDHLLQFPGFPGFPEQEPRIQDFPAFIAYAQEQHFDLALQMQGSGSLSNSILSLLGAKKTAGFSLEGLYRPDETTFLPYPVDEPEIWRHLRLLQHLQIPLQGDYLEFPIFDEDHEIFAELQKENDLVEKEYIVIHPGARAAERRWAPENFAAVADTMAEYGFHVVVTGTQEEAAITRNVLAHMNTPAIDLTGRTTYGTMAVLLSRSRLMISNDTGVSHLAAALEVPSVVLFSASEPDRWGPINQRLHRRVLWASAAPPMIALKEAEKLLQEDRVYAS